MKKNTIIIIIAVAVIALLSGAIVLVMSMNGDNIPPSTSNSTILIYDKTGVKAEEIYITTEHEEYSFFGYSYGSQADEASRIKAEESSESSDEASEGSGNYRTDTGFSSDDIKMHYTLQGHPDTELDKSRMNDLAFQCSYLTASAIVDKSGSRYAEFGLDKPYSTVRIIFSDNTVETIMIGNDAPDGQGVYFRREKSPDVYLGVTDTVNYLYQDMLFFVDRKITGELYYEPDSEEGTTISSVRLSGTLYDEDVYINNEGSIKYPVKYMMVEPRSEIVEANYVDTFGKAFYELTAKSVAAIDPDKDTIAKFGLDKPYMDVTITATDNSELHLLCSEKDENDVVYIMKSGGNAIYNMPVDGIDNWYGVTAIELMSSRIIFPDLLAMTELNITYKGKTYNFDITNTVEQNEQMQEITYTEIKYGKKTIEYSNLYDYLYALSEMYRIELCDLSAEGLEPEYTARISYKKNDMTDGDKLCVYRTEDGRCFVTLNDHTEAYVSAGYFDNFLAQLDNLVKGESIGIVEYPDESSEESNTENSKESAAESSSAA